MSQEDVYKLWVVLYLAFADAYSKIRTPEQGNKASSAVCCCSSNDSVISCAVWM